MRACSRKPFSGFDSDIFKLKMVALTTSSLGVNFTRFLLFNPHNLGAKVSEKRKIE